jgi:hypothetical protein
MSTFVGMPLGFQGDRAGNDLKMVPGTCIYQTRRRETLPSTIDAVISSIKVPI